MISRERRECSFRLAIDVRVERIPLTGKWQASYRYEPAASESWIIIGTQFATDSEAATAVLDQVRSQIPGLSADWFINAQAKLTSLL
jgi:hypothetical protein